jgi:hypothetical protein
MAAKAVMAAMFFMIFPRIGNGWMHRAFAYVPVLDAVTSVCQIDLGIYMRKISKKYWFFISTKARNGHSDKLSELDYAACERGLKRNRPASCDAGRP